MEDIIMGLFTLFFHSLTFLIPCSCIAFVLVIFGVFGFFFAKKFIKEREEIINYCKKNGLTYSDSLDNAIPAKCNNFKIAKKGKQNRFILAISGNRNNIDFDIATYVYTNYDAPTKSKIFGREVISYSGPKNKKDYTSTMCILHSNDLKLPHFFIRDESLITDSLGKVFGGQDINFNDDPVFSKKFVLQGDNEKDIRAFFNRSIRSTFVSNHKNGYVYEGFEDYLFVYAPNDMNINGKMNLLDESIKIISPLLEASNSKDNF